jgi:hypothetical protein
MLGWVPVGEGRHKERLKEIWWLYFAFMYENGRMKPVEIVL